MKKLRNTSDPSKPAYDNPTGDKGKLTDLSHGGDPGTGQNANDTKRMRKHRSGRAIGHDSDRKLGQKPAQRKPGLA